MSEVEKLRRQAGEILGRISEIEDAKATRETAQYVGRFYRYRNSYSCPETDADYWWLYFKVTGNEGRYVKGFQFQRDGDGRSNAELAERSFMSGGYTEISRGEYEAAWADFRAKLDADAAQ